MPLTGENMEESEGFTHSIKTADENMCGECEQEYTEHETEDWIYCSACSQWFDELCS